MTISETEWRKYIDKLSKISSKAAEAMEAYLGFTGFDDIEDIIWYANQLTTAYGEAAAALACEMYDEIALASGVAMPAAVPAEAATYGEVAAAVTEVSKTSPVQLPSVVGRMVKRTAADTTLKNALRDGAQFAWVPHGDTCAFCITLASRGWQYMSQKALKNGHAEHIHSNCDCEYAVRFDTKTKIAGYDPDKYLAMYENADGNKPTEKINFLRREFYAEDKEAINAQKRAAYARRAEESELYEPK